MTPNYDMDSLPATEYDRVMECIGEVLSEYRSTLSEFPQDITNAFTKAATVMMQDAAGEQDLFDRLAQLMVSSFMAGRLHAQRGYATPVQPASDTDFDIPDDLRP